MKNNFAPKYYSWTFCFFLCFGSLSAENITEDIHIRLNQVGYLKEDSKVAIAFSNQPIRGKFFVHDATSGEVVYRSGVKRAKKEGWGTFSRFYYLDFSEVKEEGRYYLSLKDSAVKSAEFGIGKSHSYKHYQEDLLGFMRQQRCGYNPFLDMVCHQRDGRTMYGPIPDSTYMDFSGGWHDAGDQFVEGEYPEDVHTSIWYLTKKEVPGGLVDGSVYGSVYNNLAGLRLAAPDEFAEFQNEHVVYHDDFGDYSTNEPTMDGTAGAIFMMAHFGESVKDQK